MKGSCSIQGEKNSSTDDCRPRRKWEDVKSKSKSESRYDRRPVSLGVKPHLGPNTIFRLLSGGCGFVDVGALSSFHNLYNSDRRSSEQQSTVLHFQGNVVKVSRYKSLVMVGLETKNNSAGESKKQHTGSEPVFAPIYLKYFHETQMTVELINTLAIS